MDNDEFDLEQARRLLRFRLEYRPEEAGSRILECFKYRAKELHASIKKASPHIRLMAVQEGLARAVGFTGSHGLQEALKGLLALLAAGERGDRLEARLDQFLPLDLLDADLRGNLPLPDGYSERLRKIARAVAANLELPDEQVLDASAEAWADASSWHDLLVRTPLTASLDDELVTFQIRRFAPDFKASGAFDYSREAHWMWDNVLMSDSDVLDPVIAADPRKAFDTALDLAKAHPCLLPAWSRASGIAENFGTELEISWSEVHHLLDEGISSAEALIPRDFHGKLSWQEMDNRPFLRALVWKVQLCLKSVDCEREALTVVSKFERYTPAGNGYLRGWAALLSARCGMAKKSTDKRIRRALDGLDPDVMHAGLALAHQGEHLRGTELFLSSVLLQPRFADSLMSVGLPSDHHLYEYPRGSVHFSDPDYECLGALAAMKADPGFRAWVEGVLSDEDFMACGNTVLSDLSALGERPDLSAWLVGVRDAARALAPPMLSKYPVTFGTRT